MEEDDDVLTALARELVTQKGIGECAAAVWKTLKHQRAHYPVPADRPSPAPPEEETGILLPFFEHTEVEQASVPSRRPEQLVFAF